MKNKKLLAVLVAMAMAASLSACGGASDSAASSSESTDSSQTQEETQSTDTGADASESAGEATGSIAQFADGWGDTNNAFDPLAISETWTFEEMRENLGAVPTSDASFAIAGNIRTEDNVY